MKWTGKIVDIYDLWWSKNTSEEIGFWQNICFEYLKEIRSKNMSKPFLPKIIELCSGTGRVLIPVVESIKKTFPNILGIGLDFSEDMNDALEKNASSLNLSENIKVYNQDLPKKKYQIKMDFTKVDIIFLPFNHWELIGNKESQENIIKNASEMLQPGGVFITVNYNYFLRKQSNTGVKELRRIIPDLNNNRVLFYWRQSTCLDEECLKAQVTYGIECIEWENNGLHIETLPATMIINYLSDFYIDELFQKYGFKKIQVYGNYKKSEFEEEKSSRRIIISQKI